MTVSFSKLWMVRCFCCLADCKKWANKGGYIVGGRRFCAAQLCLLLQKKIRECNFNNQEYPSKSLVQHSKKLHKSNQDLPLSIKYKWVSSFCSIGVLAAMCSINLMHLVNKEATAYVALFHTGFFDGRKSSFFKRKGVYDLSCATSVVLPFPC